MDLKAHYARHRRAITKTLRIMKITAIILLTACLTASANGYSQKVTLSEKNARLENVFKVVREQTGYEFLFTYEMLKKAAPVTLDLKSVELEDALAAMFKGQPLTYRIIEKTVVVKPKAEEPKENLPPPFTEVKGRLVNENDEPVVGATVTVKGTKIATSTNSNGEFKLSGVDPNATLIFSSTNIEPIEIKLNARTDLNLVAKTRISKLDEVQVIAYGTNTQRYNVGSVGKVKAEEIERQPVSNVLATLQGRVPGLVVTQSSGVPGSSFQVQVRGQNTLSARPFNIGNTNYGPVPDNPLFIIDGVIFAPQNGNINRLRSMASPGTAFTYANPYGGVSPLSSINPMDIESIEILRDADATSIYGSIGANGVILITTKKGKSGKAKLNANVSTGVSFIKQNFQMMNTQQYREFRKEAIANSGLSGLINDPSLASFFADIILWDSTKTTDWAKYFTGKTANNVDINLNVSGGNNETQFLVGGGFHKESFIMPGDYGFKRGSINSNISHRSINRKFNLSLSNNFSADESNSSSSIASNQFLFIPPNHPDFLDGLGNLTWSYKGVEFLSEIQNPLAYLKQTYKVAKNNLISNLFLSYKLFNTLTVKSSFSYSNNYSKEHTAIPRTSKSPFNTNLRSEAQFSDNKYSSWNIDPQIEYKQTFGPNEFTVLVGSSFQRRVSQSTVLTGYGYPNDGLLGSITPAQTKTSTDFHSLYKYSALFGRINYINNKRYIINITARRDGSSRFGPGRQFGNFASLGTGWIFTEEKFMKREYGFLSYGKLRASYGTAGTDNNADYDYLSNWQVFSVGYQGSGPSYLPLNLFNPDYNWALTKKFEAGLDLGFFNDKVIVTAAYYNNTCGNQLVNYTLPSQTGFTSVKRNFEAVVRNTGWEFQVNSTNVNNKNFQWSTNFNLSLPKNKLVSFPNIEKSPYSGFYLVGYSTSNARLIKYIGVNDTTGQFQFETLNGSKSYNPTYDLDNKENLDINPTFYGGIGNNFTYKGFELELFFDYAKQAGVNYLGQVYALQVGVPGNYPVQLLDRWQKPGDKAQFPKPSYTTNVHFLRSTGAYSDASYIRLKTLSLSYSLKGSILRKANIATCRIYINAQNLFTVSGYVGDPETKSIYSIPPLKSVVGGIQVTL